MHEVVEHVNSDTHMDKSAVPAWAGETVGSPGLKFLPILEEGFWIRPELGFLFF